MRIFSVVLVGDQGRRPQAPIIDQKPFICAPLNLSLKDRRF